MRFNLTNWMEVSSVTVPVQKVQVKSLQKKPELVNRVESCDLTPSYRAWPLAWAMNTGKGSNRTPRWSEEKTDPSLESPQYLKMDENWTVCLNLHKIVSAESLSPWRDDPGADRDTRTEVTEEKCEIRQYWTGHCGGKSSLLQDSVWLDWGIPGYNKVRR